VVLRPRKGMIAARGSAPALLSAIEVGVVLSCVTQAARMDLWTLDTGEWHVAADPHSKLLRRPKERTHVHWMIPPVPRPPECFEDPIENVLSIVAACQPHEHALAIWESALAKQLVTREELGRLNLGSEARALLEDAMPFSDSGLETVVVPRLRWLKLPLRRQIVIAGHRVDLLLGDRLILQIDGGHHVDAQRMQDNEHDARLRLMGYHVIRVGYAQVVGDWATVQDLVMRAVAQGLHLAR
jgi:very-short-patch-repair endonuclease